MQPSQLETHSFSYREKTNFEDLFYRCEGLVASHGRCSGDGEADSFHEANCLFLMYSFYHLCLTQRAPGTGHGVRDALSALGVSDP